MYEKYLKTIAEAIIEGEVDDAKEAVEEAVEAKVPAGEILNNGLIAGMNEVGELFKEGDMFVPEVLVAAKAMQGGIDLIRDLLVAEGVERKGKVITATVEGDLHDIGVKLVGMMLEGAGFEVKNIGVDVSAAKLIEEVKAEKPQIVGLSAMLTTTMTKMKEDIETLKEEGLTNIKVMIGGAPVSPAYADKIGAVFSADAAEAVATAKNLVNA